MLELLLRVQMLIRIQRRQGDCRGAYIYVAAHLEPTGRYRVLNVNWSAVCYGTDVAIEANMLSAQVPGRKVLRTGLRSCPLHKKSGLMHRAWRDEMHSRCLWRNLLILGRTEHTVSAPRPSVLTSFSAQRDAPSRRVFT